MNLPVLARTAIASALLTVGLSANAALIDGTISFGGGGSPEGSSTWYESTGVNYTNPWGVTDATGDYSGVPLFTLTTFTDIDWGAGSGAVNVGLSQNVWTFTYNGLTYELNIGTVTNIDRGSAANDNISVSGTGTLTITGYDPTPGNWNFTGGFSAGGAPNLSFSSDTNRVPEPASLALLSLGVAGLGVAVRRRRK